MAQLIFSPAPTAVIQQVSNGGTSSGVAPTTTADSSGASRYVFPADTVGGLFSFGNTYEWLTVCSIELALGGQTTYTVYVTDGVGDAVGNDVIVASGTTAASVLVNPSRLYLAPGQKIKVVCAGTATKLWRMTVKVALLSSEQGLWY